MTDKPRVLLAFSEAGTDLATSAEAILVKAGVPFCRTPLDAESEGPHMLVFTDHGAFNSLSELEWYLRQLDNGHFSPTDAQQESVEAT